METPPINDQQSKLSPTPKWKWLVLSLTRFGLFIAAVALALFMLGLTQRFGWINSGSGTNVAGTHQHDHGETFDSSPKRYVCPMMCVPPSTEPGRCPVCGMELVEATGGSSGGGTSITIEPAARRLIGIQTATSQRGQLFREIRTIGSITYDESRLSDIAAYIDGRLEKMYANFVGIEVEEGDDLALVYSPQLFTAQTEFVTSLSNQSRDNRFGLSDFTDVSRRNLIELGMTEEQVAELEKSRKPNSRITIKSPQSGTVIEKTAVEGQYVKTGQPIYRVADLGTVWMMLDLFPVDAAVVRFGQQVEAEIQSRPGEVYTGRVGFIDPTVNSTTRIVRVRVEFLNFDRSLKPGDYATAKLIVPSVATKTVYDPALAGNYISPMHPQVIRDEPGTCPLCDMDLVPTSQYGYSDVPIEEKQPVIVPRSSVLLAGDDAVVYVEIEPGKFEVRRVTLGPMNSTQAAIIQGIAEGEVVATAGNFLIDSQMQLAGNPSLLDPGKLENAPESTANVLTSTKSDQ